MAKKEKEEPEEKQEGEEEETPKKSKKGLFMGGGLVGLIALAYIVSLIAVPSGPKVIPPFTGPFVAFPLGDNPVQVNMKGGGGKRFLVANFKTEYDAYEAAYAEARIADDLFQAQMGDALIRLGRNKTTEDLDEFGLELLKNEIRDKLAPLLFPVHIGNMTSSTAMHEESGLKPGNSILQSTMRGGFKGHVLTVDAPKNMITLGQGNPTSFQGNEKDLVVENEAGQIIFINVTELKPDFVGEVQVGTFGNLRAIHFTKLITQ